MSKRYFDLNIEEVLENWEVYHGVREVISNALDETKLTKCKPIDIFKDDIGLWHIRDYGRGINHTHFSQNENEEKLNAEGMIGKFGVGLKDAFAVFHRHGIDVKIQSKYGLFTTDMHAKEDFGDIETLHIAVAEPLDTDFVGTEFTLSISDLIMSKATELFLAFTGVAPLEKTEYGEIYPKRGDTAIIYVNGIQVAEEENYMFSYNITKLYATMRKALNRERTNVGRVAYADTVKKLLLNSRSEYVIDKLINELKKYNIGGGADEINYVDIQVHAMRMYNAQKPVVFISQMEAFRLTNDDKEKIQESGREPVIVPYNAFDKIGGTNDYKGNKMGTFDVVREEYSANFNYEWVKPSSLSPQRKKIWDKHPMVMDWLGDKKWRKRLKISKNINDVNFGDTFGVHDPVENAIIIKESVLDIEAQFYDVLIHEYIHATTGYSDNTREFENALGSIIGKMGMEIFNKSATQEQNDVLRKTRLGGLLGRR